MSGLAGQHRHRGLYLRDRTMKVAVIVFPGSNCDRDVKVAFEKAMKKPPLMIWHQERTMPEVDLVVLPGGFSYGDYLRSGAMAAHSPIMNEVIRLNKSGTRILGICNGFQILTETGLLPGVLIRNIGLRFICKNVDLRVETTDTIFTHKYRPKETIRLPIAHHDGNYQADTDTLKQLQDQDRIAFTYASSQREVSEQANINGSKLNIAGIFNRRKTVLGMMPHPERRIDRDLGGCDGTFLFNGLVEALS